MPALNRIHSREVRGWMFRAFQNDTRSGWIDSLCDKVNATQITEEYADVGMPPAMREWKGGRAPKTLREDTFPISNVKYEASIVVPRDDLILEKADKIQQRISQLSIRAGTEHWKKLVTTLIENGEATACYDGQYFFDTDHVSASSGTQDNDITNNITTTTAPTTAEMTTSIMAAIVKILGFKDDQGELMNDGINDFLIMVPLPYMEVTNVAVNANLTGSGASNELKVQGLSLGVVVNPRLTWTTKFAVFANNSITKPFITQQLEDVRVSAKAEGSDFEFDNDAHEYGVSAYRAAGYGAWQSACLVTHT